MPGAVVVIGLYRIEELGDMHASSGRRPAAPRACRAAPPCLPAPVVRCAAGGPLAAAAEQRSLLRPPHPQPPAAALARTAFAHAHTHKPAAAAPMAPRGKKKWRRELDDSEVRERALGSGGGAVEAGRWLAPRGPGCSVLQCLCRRQQPRTRPCVRARPPRPRACELHGVLPPAPRRPWRAWRSRATRSGAALLWRACRMSSCSSWTRCVCGGGRGRACRPQRAATPIGAMRAPHKPPAWLPRLQSAAPEAVQARQPRAPRVMRPTRAQLILAAPQQVRRGAGAGCAPRAVVLVARHGPCMARVQPPSGPTANTCIAGEARHQPAPARALQPQAQACPGRQAGPRSQAASAHGRNRGTRWAEGSRGPAGARLPRRAGSAGRLHTRVNASARAGG